MLIGIHRVGAVMGAGCDSRQPVARHALPRAVAQCQSKNMHPTLLLASFAAALAGAAPRLRALRA